MTPMKFFILKVQAPKKYDLFVVGKNISIFVTNRQWHKLYRASVELYVQEKQNYLELKYSWSYWFTTNPKLSSSQALAFTMWSLRL